MPWFGFVIVGLLLFAVFLMTVVERRMPWKEGAALAVLGVTTGFLLTHSYRNWTLIQVAFVLIALMWIIMGRHLGRHVRETNTKR